MSKLVRLVDRAPLINGLARVEISLTPLRMTLESLRLTKFVYAVVDTGCSPDGRIAVHALEQLGTVDMGESESWPEDQFLVSDDRSAKLKIIPCDAWIKPAGAAPFATDPVRISLHEGFVVTPTQRNEQGRRVGRSAMLGMGTLRAGSARFELDLAAANPNFSILIPAP